MFLDLIKSFCFRQYFIIGVIVKFLLQQRLQLPQHVVEWPCGQLGPKQLFMLSGGDRFDSVMIQSNCGE